MEQGMGEGMNGWF